MMVIIVLSVSSLVFAASMRKMMQPSEIPMEPYDSERGTWFGHYMSPEGEWRHIPVVLCATYSFVWTFGALASLASPATHLLTIPAFYVVGLVAFYIWHLAAHHLESTELNAVHMIHHRDQYPQDDFYGDQCDFVQDEKNARGGMPHTMLSLMNPLGNSTMKSVAHEGPLVFAMASIIAFAKFVLGASTASCVFALLGYVFMASFGSALHMSFHERNFQLEPYAWYRELRSLHMIHHMHRKNYAMVNIMLDVAFSSLLISE